MILFNQQLSKRHTYVFEQVPTPTIAGAVVVVVDKKKALSVADYNRGVFQG